MARSEEAIIEVRRLQEHVEFAEAVRLQRIIWGFDDLELLPVRFFVVANKVGGQTIGAFDGNRMIGFLLGIPGLKPGGVVYMHSHMMGVLDRYRNAGVGRMLKFAQRDDALASGLDLVEWTFDPLEIKNAFFNIERLGVVIRRYVLNQYGKTTSALHGGLPTDRCIAEWWLRREKPAVQNIVERIPVPADIAMVRSENPKLAGEIQKRISDQFLESFSKGLAVVGFERSEEAGTYLLAPWES
jgi:predicted GNAT superfamily acetyltransferase